MNAQSQPPFFEAQRLYDRSINCLIGVDDLRAVAAWKTDEISVLFAAADQVRKKFFADRVDPCTLMNVKSGNCPEDCAFCTQSAHNKADVKIQNLADKNEIIAKCHAAWEKKLPFCVVASGRKLSREELQKICDALTACGNGGEKHASLGILDSDEFDMLAQAGVICYNHNLETARSHFANIVTTHTYDDRVNTVKRAKSAGLKVCCGAIFAMGETWEQRIELCLELRDLGVDTVPINFLNVVEGTRINVEKVDPLELLKIVSMFRLAMPKATIKVCGGREKNLGALQSLIFHAGANGYITGGYLTTCGNTVEDDDLMISSLGLIR